jgi:hypothetical protein
MCDKFNVLDTYAFINITLCLYIYSGGKWLLLITLGSVVEIETEISEDEVNVPHTIPAISEEVYLNSREVLVILTFRHWLPSSIIRFPNDISHKARFCVHVEKEDILKHSRRGKEDKAKCWKCWMKFQINDVWGENRHSVTQGGEAGDDFETHFIQNITFCNLCIVTSHHTVNKPSKGLDISLWHCVYIYFFPSGYCGPYRALASSSVP